jgi:type II secretory pathway pseudopilin PulG
MKNIFCDNETGVSLTETLVAIAVLAIITAALAGGLVVGIKSDQVARNHISAEGLARYELEYVKAANYWGPSLASNNWTYTLPGAAPTWDTTHNSIPTAYTGYTVTVTAVTPPPGSDYSGATTIQKVTAAVSYSGSQVISIDLYRTQ